MRKTIIASVFFFASTAGAFAAEFGDLAGTYAGSTDKGSAVSFSIPKKGLPTYRFKGESVPVNTASVAGKTITMKVGSGGGLITLTSNGKGQMAMRYSFKADRASATLTKQ